MANGDMAMGILQINPDIEKASAPGMEKSCLYGEKIRRTRLRYLEEVISVECECE